MNKNAKRRLKVSKSNHLNYQMDKRKVEVKFGNGERNGRREKGEKKKRRVERYVQCIEANRERE